MDGKKIILNGVMATLKGHPSLFLLDLMIKNSSSHSNCITHIPFFH